MIASQCYLTGRTEAAVRYSDAGQTVIGSGRDEVPLRPRRLVGAVYLHRSARTVGRVVPRPTRARPRHPYIHQGMPGHRTGDRRSPRRGDGRRGGLVDAAEATRNPYVLSFALLAYGLAFRDADPDGRACACAEAW